MRTKYPLVSQELTDAILQIYSQYVYLLGRDDDEGITTYSGFYDIAEEDMQSYINEYIVLRNNYDPTPSGIPIAMNVDLMSYRRSIVRG